MSEPDQVTITYAGPGGTYSVNFGDGTTRIAAAYRAAATFPDRATGDVVCMTHRHVIPCPENHPMSLCSASVMENDLEYVRAYQKGTAP